MTTNFEKYLAGEPLNEELAALWRGEAPPIGAGLAGGSSADLNVNGGAGEETGAIDDLRPLRAEERAALRETRQGPGWPVLQKLLKRGTIQRIRFSTALSEDDPLGKRDEIALAWLEVKVWKQLVNALTAMVELELAEQRREALDGRENEVEPAQQRA